MVSIFFSCFSQAADLYVAPTVQIKPSTPISIRKKSFSKNSPEYVDRVLAALWLAPTCYDSSSNSPRTRLCIKDYNNSDPNTPTSSTPENYKIHK